MADLRKILLVLLASAFLLGPHPSQAAPSSAAIDHRIWEQQQRLDQGARTGSLTPGEYYRLEENLWRIISKKAQLEADGCLTGWELGDLNRELDESSQAIFRSKNKVS